MIPTFKTKHEYLVQIKTELINNVIDKVFDNDKDAHHEFKLVNNYVNWLKGEHFNHVVVVLRSGGTHFVHYTAAIRRGGRWFLCDDLASAAQPVNNLNATVGSSVYMFVYHRAWTRM